MKNIALIFTLALTSALFSQINIDSLQKKIFSNCTKTGEREYLKENFSIYKNDSGTEQFDLFLDSNNNLQEHIGLSIVHYSYDSLKRLDTIQGFGVHGERRYWDFPALQTFSYISDSAVDQMDQIQLEIDSNFKKGELYNLVLSKERSFGEDSLYKFTRVSITAEDSLKELKYSICRTGKICDKGNGVKFIYREYSKNLKGAILHERYYDEKLNLIDGLHDVYLSSSISESASIEYSYTIRRIDANHRITNIIYFDKTGKVVGHEMRGVSSPIPNPSTVD